MKMTAVCRPTITELLDRFLTFSMEAASPFLLTPLNLLSAIPEFFIHACPVAREQNHQGFFLSRTLETITVPYPDE